MLCQSSVGTRPSALYTLHHIPGHGGMSPTPRRFRYGDREMQHTRRAAAEVRPSSCSGQLREAVLLDYVTYVRSRCPNAPVGDHAFVNANGRPLTPSQGQRKPGTPSAKLRMGSTPSYLHGLQKGSRHRASHSRAPKKGGQATLDDVCLTMTHSRATSDRYYDRDLRRDAAIRAHGRIRALMQQEDQE